MPPPAIIDTNVVVAGLLTGCADSPVARILDGMLAAAFPFVLSDALLAEYASVLQRPALQKLHGLSGSELDVLLTELAQHAIILTPTPADTALDPGDRHLWSLLASRNDLFLVTGDQLLLQDRAMAGRILSPAGFAERWLSEGRQIETPSTDK